jgi:hypothetical protein
MGNQGADARCKTEDIVDIKRFEAREEGGKGGRGQTIRELVN